MVLESILTSVDDNKWVFLDVFGSNSEFKTWLDESVEIRQNGSHRR